MGNKRKHKATITRSNQWGVRMGEEGQQVTGKEVQQEGGS